MNCSVHKLHTTVVFGLVMYGSSEEVHNVPNECDISATFLHPCREKVADVNRQILIEPLTTRQNFRCKKVCGKVSIASKIRGCALLKFL